MTFHVVVLCVEAGIVYPSVTRSGVTLNINNVVAEASLLVKDWSEQIASGAVLLTVNQRLARHHSANYQRWQLMQGNQWWDTPAILPLRAWLISVHCDALCAGISSLTLMPDLLQQRAWRHCIERDDSVALLDTEAAAKLARQAWQTACAWQCFNNAQDYLPQDQYVWQRWCSSYAEWLAEHSCMDDSMLADHIAGIVSVEGASSLLPSQLILDGFLQLPPQLQNLKEVLIAVGVDVEVVARAPQAYVHRVEYQDDSQELLSIATHMRQELARDTDQSLGLVVSDLQQRRASVLRAFDRVFFPTLTPDEIRSVGRPYDVSLGLPLSDIPVINIALLSLKLCISKIEGSDISAWLLTPYVLAAQSESRRREQMDRRLRDDRVRSLSIESLLDHLYSGSRLAAAARYLLKMRRTNRATLSVWAARFSEWLKILGWPGKAIDSEEYQAVSSWLECLDDMQLLDDNEAVTVSAAFSQLQRLATERIFQLDTPYTPIQIMGRLESHGIGFDCLWVAGLDTEQWPPAGSPSPFLSMARQKAQGIPEASASARLALAEREFLMWGSQSPLLIASHAKLRDGKRLTPAVVPFIEASKEYSAVAEERMARISDSIKLLDPVSEIKQAITVEVLTDNYGPALPGASEVRGGARLFEDQALCPFRAFALHRLRIRPLEEAGLGLDPRQHGTLLHLALEMFWSAVRTHDALIALGEEGVREKVAVVVKTAIAELKVPDALRALEQSRLSTLVCEWLMQCEVPRQAFEVVSLEQRQSIEHGGIVMNVMLDRIDRVGDGLVVVDYKTGTSNAVNTWADERIVNPQLPLYVLTNEEIEGATFAQVAKNQCSFKGVASDSALLPRVKTTVNRSRTGGASDKELEQWSQWRAHWRESLDTVAAEVRQGLATITPMKTACVYCELKSLCRINADVLEVDETTMEQEIPGTVPQAGS